jgi:uncharacterized protein
VACVALLPAACVLKHSASARLYVLQAVAEEPAAATGDAPRGVLGVQRVSVPAWMDRPEITARSGRGEIVPDPLARWGEPITRGIQRVVTENLAILLPQRHLVAAPFPVSHPVDHRLDLAITEGARQADGRVLLEARWAILGPDGAILVQRRSSHRTGVASTAEATVSATSEALALLSGEIAAAVRGLAPAQSSAFPLVSGKARASSAAARKAAAWRKNAAPRPNELARSPTTKGAAAERPRPTL